jgi:alkane 1-monooxygenase
VKATVRNSAYGLSLLPGVLVVYGNLHAGGWYAATNLIFSLVVLGLIDAFNPTVLSQEHSGKQDTIPNLVLWLHVVLQITCVGSFVYAVVQQIHSDYTLFAMALSMAVYTGSGAIVVAHEFIHRKNPLSQWAGKLLLFTAGNFYFFIEHLRVHHKWVGTTDDPATAHRGQSVYDFFVSSSLGQIKGAWKLETERCKQKGFSFLQHYMLRQLVLHLLFDTTLLIVAGPLALLAWFIHCILANFLLEYVNYIEHYGLNRNKNERVTELHSWQSDRFVSRFFLVDLSRHADHHYYASKPYHTLESFEQSPVLPGGYASLIIPALIPFWWRKLTHPILDKL